MTGAGQSCRGGVTRCRGIGCCQILHQGVVRSLACICNSGSRRRSRNRGVGFGRRTQLGFCRQVFIDFHHSIQNLCCFEGFPEFQLRRPLQEFANPVWVINPGQLDIDTTGTLLTLDIGRGDPELVNTGAQDIKRTIDGALGLGTDHFNHFLIGGIKIDPALILASRKNAGQAVFGSHFAVGLNKQGHKIGLGTRLTLGCQIHGSVKTSVLALVAEGPDNILNLHFHDHVHPTLKVQA